MRPIIMDMRDMSDSVEVYESKPNRFMIYTIYVIASILLVAFIWVYVSRMDMIVKANGIFRSSDETIDVSVELNGVVSNVNVKEGQYVKEGDILFLLDTKSLDNAMGEYEVMLSNTEDRILMLEAYDKYLSGESDVFDNLKDNQYYEEFVGKKKLIDMSVENVGADSQSQIKRYEAELENVETQISAYELQIEKLRQVQKDVQSRNNSFESSDSYYYSMVSSYILNYNLTEQQYSSLGDEKTEMLNNIEKQEIAGIEQQIQTISSSLNTAKASKISLEASLGELKGSGKKNTAEMSILTERQNVATELNNCYSKRDEYKSAINQYAVDSGKASIVAKSSGYIYLTQSISIGSYLVQGTTVCKILPENVNGYYAEIYVDNGDVAKLKVGQEVKFEIAAYPSSDYGYFSGIIESISKDIKVDETSGSAYYLVRVKCDEKKAHLLMPGMACQAKIVVGEKRVISYLLEKLDLVD